jgi:hypothetical protein
MVLCAQGCAKSMPVGEPLGRDSRPYTAIPRYLVSAASSDFGLSSARPSVPEAAEVPVAGPRPLPIGVPRERVRVLLAVVDAHLAALGLVGEPKQMAADQTALVDATRELARLVKAYPDLWSDAEEMRVLAEKLPLPAAKADRARARMSELTDLIRLQLAAAK